ncbi:hypothetical protein OXYTRIMIC_158 [Oxytricha trifallax]|uniref:Uncharacterized protein n=1 Tax=Oxytricha trifallax TaxID=1172189 RepID=A0A073IBE6_9SPIT|nr:hypothetical protein OXYTRIMIC_158 [Oxytricha trifallax]
MKKINQNLKHQSNQQFYTNAKKVTFSRQTKPGINLRIPKNKMINNSSFQSLRSKAIIKIKQNLKRKQQAKLWHTSRNRAKLRKIRLRQMKNEKLEQNQETTEYSSLFAEFDVSESCDQRESTTGLCNKIVQLANKIDSENQCAWHCQRKSTTPLRSTKNIQKQCVIPEIKKTSNDCKIKRNLKTSLQQTLTQPQPKPVTTSQITQKQPKVAKSKSLKLKAKKQVNDSQRIKKQQKSRRAQLILTKKPIRKIQRENKVKKADRRKLLGKN